MVMLLSAIFWLDSSWPCHNVRRTSASMNTYILLFTITVDLLEEVVDYSCMRSRRIN